MNFNWDEEKNEWLKKTRGFSYKELLENGRRLSTEKNTSSNHQNQLEVHIFYKNYVYKVAFLIEKNGDWFLKTAYQNRKLTRDYKNKGLI